MKYTLMQAENPVLDIDIDTEFGLVNHIGTLHNEKRLPLSVLYGGNKIKDLNAWLTARSIPKSRKNIIQLLSENKVKTPNALMVKNLGLSLSDQYWLNPQENSMSWKNVNLYENNFSTVDMTNYALSQSQHSYSPDSSLNGQLIKFWEATKKSRLLYKESTVPFMQQAYNEAFASQLLDTLHIPHVSYSILFKDEIPYSVCPIFTSIETEYIPAAAIWNVRFKKNHENSYMHFLACIEKLQIPVSKREIDNMLAFDYLISNEDRHTNNFGFIRNSRTLEFIGMAPLFDHGNSMWYMNSNYDIKLSNRPAKPFHALQEKQIQYASDENLSLAALTDVFLSDTVKNVYGSNPRFDTKRLDLFSDRLCALRDRLMHIREKRQPHQIHRDNGKNQGKTRI